MTRVQRKVIDAILGRYKIAHNDLFLKGNHRYPSLIFAQEEICYTLATKHYLSLREIAKALKYSRYQSISLMIKKYIKRNKLTYTPKKSPKHTLKIYIDMLTKLGIDADDALSVLKAVYRSGYIAGHNSAQRNQVKKFIDNDEFCFLPKPGATLVPPDENNAPVSFLEAPRGILEEGDTSEIKPPDRVKTANS